MSEFRARIGCIRLKNGGAEVRLLRQDNPHADRRGEIMRHTRCVVDASRPEDPLVGQLVIGFFAKGGTSVGVYYDNNTCPIPRALLPAWIEEIMRREMIVDPEARDVFNHMFYWRDGAS